MSKMSSLDITCTLPTTPSKATLEKLLTRGGVLVG